MTITYDSKNHFEVIFSIHGTVWPNVLSLCIANASLTTLIYCLGVYDIVDLTFDDDGHNILATMVAFLVVSRVSSAYNRFWEARTLLSQELQQCRQLSMLVAAFTRNDKTVKAQEWRRLICKRTIEMLQLSIQVLEDSEWTTELMHGPEEGKKPKWSKDPRKNPLTHAGQLHEVICLHEHYLQAPLVIHKELKLHSFVASFSDYYSELAKFSATPYPFPTAQMTRIFLFVWMFSLPFALVHEVNEPYSIVCIVFFITYGFFGLEFVSIELDDP